MALDTAPEVRSFAPGIGTAVADRTVARMIERMYDEPIFLDVTLPRDDAVSLDEAVARYARAERLIHTGYHVKKGDDLAVSITLYVAGVREREQWRDVARRVALGNCALHGADFDREFPVMHKHMRKATLLMSGRHLQHGDETQPSRNMEVFTNCATAASTFLLFYLLLNGAGVGRDYSDAMIVADPNNMPIVVPVIDFNHPDAVSGRASAMTLEEVRHLYAGRNIRVFRVPDSREGWGQAVEVLEAMTFENRRDDVFVPDFSDVRPHGAPIGGMQNRPASGPGPLMSAFTKVAKLRDAGMEPWRAALYMDHYLAEVVLVGGARRAARMSTKWWRDPGVLDFIRVKNGGQFLWSSNNSVTVDAEFWSRVRLAKAARSGALGAPKLEELAKLDLWAEQVYDAVIDAAYDQKTGEPGFINVDRLHHDPHGLEVYDKGVIAESKRYKIDEGRSLLSNVVHAMRDMPYRVITNPCGEIVLLLLGGYCVIADVVPYHADTLDEAEDAFRTAARALMRVNLMDSLYRKEVRRTNRIGVGFTGIFEFALKFFGLGWRDLVDEEKSIDFWRTMARFSVAVKSEALRYSHVLNVTPPFTDTTVKPAGTTSKLFGLTEGAHLPAMLEYLRWVQFRDDDPLVAEYRAKGYPIKKLRTYSGTTVVGFPTAPEIVQLAKQLGLEDKLVTAAEATPEEQFEWLRLLEKWWIRGGPDRETDSGNQVSYTLKYDPAKIDKRAFSTTILANQPTVKCVSVMPQIDTTAYEYQPEQPVTKQEFERIAAAVAAAGLEESVDFEHLACEGGACPVDFTKGGI